MRLIREVVSDTERLDWSRWAPYVLDDRAASIDDWAGPWHRRVDDLPVDPVRTAGLAAFDVPVRARGGTIPREGASAGKPWNVITGAERTQRVWNLSRPVAWRGLTPKLPIERLPLPDVVKRQGDPAGASDLGLILLQPGVRLIEAIAFEDRHPLQMLSLAPIAVLQGVTLSVGYHGARTGLYGYDLTVPWTRDMGGTSAAGLPKLPLLLRADELERGQVNHALFCSLPNYSTEAPVGMASGTDGEWPGHPVRSGDILRLTAAALDRFSPGSKEHTVAVAMAEHGVVCGDKASHGDPRDGSMVIGCALDSRIGQLNLGLSLSDFEIVAQ